MLAIGILTVILAILLPVGLDFYRSYQMDSEYDLLKSLLQRTRNFAMINRNESAHGLYLDAGNFIVFQGADFSARVPDEDRIFPRSAAVSVTGPAELVFSALSGRTASTTYVVSNGYASHDIYVNAEGLVY